MALFLFGQFEKTDANTRQIGRTVTKANLLMDLIFSGLQREIVVFRVISFQPFWSAKHCGQQNFGYQMIVREIHIFAKSYFFTKVLLHVPEIEQPIHLTKNYLFEEWNFTCLFHYEPILLNFYHERNISVNNLISLSNNIKYVLS